MSRIRFHMLRLIAPSAAPTFSRLVYLAGAHDAVNGRYPAPDVSALDEFRCRDISPELEHLHREAFMAWRSLYSGVQYAELTAYLTEQSKPSSLLDRWVQQGWQEKLIPSGTHTEEKALFISTFWVLVGILTTINAEARPHTVSPAYMAPTNI